MEMATNLQIGTVVDPIGPGSEKQEFSPEKYRIAMWVALAAILMMFTAMVSTYVVLASTDSWRSIPFPKQLWLSTALILVSSFAFKKSFTSLEHGDYGASSRWLWLTLALGLAFLVSQFAAWRQSMARGIQLDGNARALFYVLTGLHGIHVIVGIGALGYLLLGSRVVSTETYVVKKRQTIVGVVGLYWHFMCALWVCLFLLLLFW